MSAIDDDTPSLILVPNDPELPVFGPWMVTNGYVIDGMAEFAKNELGLTPDQFSIRGIVYADGDGVARWRKYEQDRKDEELKERTGN